MINRLLLLSIFTVASLYSVSVMAEEKAVWDKTPINITLKPNTERVITFPFDRAKAGIPAGIKDKLATLSNNGIIYWHASEEFTSQQVLVKDKDTQQIIIINLSSNDESGSDEPITILRGEAGTPSDAKNTASSTGVDSTPIRYGYDALTRVVAKHIYAPSRLIELPPNMHRVHVKPGSNSFLIRLHNIKAEPVISFSNNGLYVTAVNLVNNEPEKIILDPRDLRGRWLTATFQHVVLGASGMPTDTTTLYLVSKRPFWDSM
tara:strand:- start:4957 stop:5742 length:786 start_codon:yes stop_codon:yes gene_type:complete